MARSASCITPDQLLRIFDEAPSSNVLPSQLQQQFKFYTHPPLLPGEQIITQSDHVICVDTFNDIAQGVLHITTYRVIFAGSYAKDPEEHKFVDAEPEEVAKRGHRHQTQGRHSSLGHSVSNGCKDGAESQKRQDKWPRSGQKFSKMIKAGGGSLARGLRHSQSMKGSKYAASVRPAGLCDQTVKLRTLRPVVMSNLEHVDHSYELVASVPLTSVCDIRKFSKKNLPKNKQVFLMDGFEVLCSNIQSYRFCLGLQSTLDAEYIMRLVMYNLKVGFSKSFAFTHRKSMLLPKSLDILDKKDAANFLKFKVESDRLKLFETLDWKVCNEKLPLQYPSNTIISSVLSYQEVAEVANFHRGGCFPAVCWRHKQSGAVMLRSSATLNRRGLKDSRCKADEKYLASISSCSEAPSNKLVVFTEQMRQSGGASQQVTQMTGQLTPQEGETFYYPNTRFIYGDAFPDFKAVRQSACKLQAHLSSRIDDAKWLSSLDDTDWLAQVSELLRTATQISVAMVCDKSCVLISYEEGLDGTAQLASLSQLLMDPYYRTVKGFQVLIQKEWLSFGHRFFDRTLSSQGQDEHGPVFLQWLDCVWQVLQQFPFSFQFNGLLLQVIAEHAYSSRFGTFLVNSEREREEEDIEEKTYSLWTWLNVVTMSDPDRFVNPRYDADYHQRVLQPQYRIPYLKLWSAFFVNRYRHDHVQEAHKAAKLEALKLQTRYKLLLQKYSECLDRLANVDSEDYSSKISFYTATLSRAPLKDSSSDHQLCLPPSDSNSSLSSLDALSGTWASVRSDLAEEDSDFLKSSMMSSSSANRRMTRSRSLDDMLHVAPHRQKSQKKTLLKRRVGSSKFYTEELLNSKNKGKEPTNDVRNHPISEKYSSLTDYLDSTGIEYQSEPNVRVLKSQCCGYMIKQGQVRKSWKKRWFVLDLTKTYLAYFETEKAESPKGAINCNAITHVYEHGKCGKGKRRFLFCVDTADRTYTIDAPSEQSMNIWMTCLKISPTAIELPRD